MADSIDSPRCRHTMNEIIKNTQPFLETLQSASGEEVKKWDLEALQRAVEWAKYFEEVHEKLKDRPKHIEKLNRGLYLIGHLPGAAGSHSAITFESLSQSLRLLLQALLQNPYLSADLYSEVIKQYALLGQGKTSSGGSQQAERREDSQYKMLIQDVSRFAKAKATRMHLLEMRMKLTQSLKEETKIEGKSVQHVTMETDASLLRDHLIHHMTENPPPQKTKDYLTNHLHDVGSQSNGLVTIETVLGLLRAEGEKEAAAVRQCEQFVLQWIANNRAQYTDCDDMELG